ncbi:MULTISPECIES: glutamine amidotransferase [unclassified Sphingobium]|uniref:glutamine amidotransferase n=1 Tax=unclassified Sphingobium TaxID=2611147 RepID=UPI00222492C3|nr:MULTISPECIES: glutamine amidotransferase [unclassified Sphingobium]MCW2350178.1 GMP synthase (glutamine-hydrolyzing) [Sphingobium sp. B12D2B]MCW2369282.1 GMP synthase (glutamine-hydrolyzing) [Sphingobium sp. B11D3D]
MKRALVIRHVPHEGMAGYREPVEAAGYAIDRIDVTDPAFATLDLREPDLLIMMGGPMGVYEQDRYPWIACQLRRLALRLAADRPTLGVCFGAQMIAAALGAKVYPGPVKEVGFHSVKVNDAGHTGPLCHLVDVPVLHWHGDTFTLPEGTQLLASSDRYTHQAFRRGQHVLALQFHAEMGEDARFYQWMEEWPEAAAESGGCNDSLRAAHDRLGPRAVSAGRAMLGDWLAGLKAPA